MVETTREIGGAIGVAAVATVLISHAGLGAFHAAFWVIVAVAAFGALVAAISFPRPRMHDTGADASTTSKVPVLELEGDAR